MAFDLDKQDKLAVLFFFCCAVIIYANSLTAPFYFDDSLMIEQNVLIKHPGHILDFFKGNVTSVGTPAIMFRPLLMVTFLANYLAGGLNPVGYHIINILLHFLNAIVLYLLLRQLCKDAAPGLAVLVSAIFLVHPMNTEAVTYISSRSDLLLTLCLAMGFLYYLRKGYVVSSLWYVAGLLVKESALCFGILLAVYEFVFFRRPADGTGQPGKKRAYYLTVILSTVVYLGYRSLILKSGGVSLDRALGPSILTQAAVTFFYLKMFFFPYPLAIFHDFPILTALKDPAALASICGIIGLVGLGVYLRKKQPLVSLGIAWYLTCLIPKFYARLNIVAAEHHFYLPSLGLYLIVCVLLIRLYAAHRRQIYCAATVIIAVFGALVWLRNYEYSDSLRLWKSTVDRAPLSARAHNQLGLEYVKLGDLDKAEKEFKIMSGLSKETSDFINSRGNLAGIYLQKKQYSQAIGLLNELTKIEPVPPKVYENLGAAYMAQGRQAQAVSAWSKEIELYPQSQTVYLQLGFYYLQANAAQEAVKFFDQAVEHDPQSVYGYYGLGRAYAQTKDPAAIPAFLRAVELDHGFAPAYNDLAVIYASLSEPDWDKADRSITKAKALGYPVDNGLEQMIKQQLKAKNQ